MSWLCSTVGGVTTAHDTETAAKAEQIRLSPVTACVWFCSGIEELGTQIESRESA